MAKAIPAQNNNLKFFLLQMNELNSFMDESLL